MEEKLKTVKKLRSQNGKKALKLAHAPSNSKLVNMLSICCYHKEYTIWLHYVRTPQWYSESYVPQHEKDHGALDACQPLYKSKESNGLSNLKSVCLLSDHQSVITHTEQKDKS